MVSPAGLPARLRGLQVHDRAVRVAGGGQRIAINLSGPRLERSRVRRGEWIIDPALHRPSSRPDVRLRLLAEAGLPLKHWTSAHVHLGTASVKARIGLAQPLPPGGEALAQLVLDAPVAALWGDRFALRDAPAQRTLGGGFVLDPFASSPRRRQDVAVLEARARDDHAAAFAGLLEAAPAGLDASLFPLARNLGDAEAERLLAGLVTIGGTSFSSGRWSALQEEIMAALDALGEANAQSWGVTEAELAAALPRPLRPVAPAAVRQVAASSPGGILTVGRCREATRTGRHATMPLLDFLDRQGVTRRIHEGRQIRGADEAAAVKPTSTPGGPEVAVPIRAAAHPDRSA